MQPCHAAAALPFLGPTLRCFSLCYAVQPLPPLDTVAALAAASAICPVAHLLLGPRRFNTLRTPLVLTTRLLAMHSVLHAHFEDVLTPGQSWPVFSWQLLLVAGAVSQTWFSIAWQLPLLFHAAAVLLTAAQFLGIAPGRCLAPQGGATPSFLGGSAQEFESMASWLDWSLTPFASERAWARLLSTSQRALCVTVMTWVHLAAGVSTAAAVHILRGGHRSQARGVGDGPSRRQQRRREEDQVQLRSSAAWEAVAHALFACQVLWCVLRVACISFF